MDGTVELADTDWIFNWCIDGLALTGHPILSGCRVGLAGYGLNIQLVYQPFSLMAIQYCLDGTVGLAGYRLNIQLVYQCVA